MRPSHYGIAVLAMLFNFLATNVYAIGTSALVKVTPENDVKCVEYYTMQGEMYCSTKALSVNPVTPNIKQYELLKIQFDDRPWQLAWGKKDAEITTVEYVPQGENINQWNELITSQAFPGLQNKVTLKQFAELFIQRLKNLGYAPIVTVIEDNKNQYLFEFRIEKPESQIQDELQMITKDKNNLYVLHYTIKKADMGEKEREKWTSNLKATTIKK